MVRRKTRGKGTKEMLKACTRLRANKAFLGNFLGEFVAQSYLWVDKDGFLWETFLPKLVRSFVSKNMDLIPRSLGSIQCSKTSHTSPTTKCCSLWGEKNPAISPSTRSVHHFWTVQPEKVKSCLQSSLIDHSFSEAASRCSPSVFTPIRATMTAC